MMRKQPGFTIVELLIVIVVIGILAAVSIVAYNGIKDRANNTKVQAELTQVHKQIATYHAETGAYPTTGGLSGASTRVDPDCTMPGTTRTAAWVPDLPSTASLPRSGTRPTGVSGNGGCYIYASDGAAYILSAWNMHAGEPQKQSFYRRLGFREATVTTGQYYICNHTNIGGSSSGTYVERFDYYKYSYTFSNITSCSETPPAGA